MLLAAAAALGALSVGALTAPFTTPARTPTDVPPSGASADVVGRRLVRQPPPQRATRRTSSPPTAREWATLLDHVSTSLRSGDSLLTAWTAALDERPIIGQAVAPARSLADTVAGTTTDADEAVVVQSLAAASQLGGPMAATIDAAAALLRERDTIRAEASAHSAQARLSARVLTAVPLVFASWSTVTSDSFRHSLATPVGSACVALGAVLNLAGWRWMRRVVGGATR